MRETSVLTQILSVYSLVLVIVGTIGNSLGIYVCFRRRLRIVPTFVFYGFMLAFDIIGLYLWNLDHFLLTFFDFELESFGIGVCKAVTILHTFGSQSSAWLLTAITFERCLSAVVRLWRAKYFKSKQAFITSIVIFTIILIKSTIFGCLINEPNQLNKSDNLSCYDSPVYVVLMREHIIMYSVLPFILMVCCNSVLAYQLLSMSKTNVRKKTDKSSIKQKSSIISIMALAIFFMISTLPTSIASAFYLHKLYTSDFGLTLFIIFDSFDYSFHSFNLIVLIIANKQFRLEVFELLKRSKRLTLTFHRPITTTNRVGPTLTIRNSGGIDVETGI